MRASLVVLSGFLVLTLASLAGILALVGKWQGFDRGPLAVELVVEPFELPSSFGVDPLAISDALVRSLSDRAANDLALRMMLGQEANAQLRDIAIPRLVNAGVIRRMLDEIEVWTAASTSTPR